VTLSTKTARTLNT